MKLNLFNLAKDMDHSGNLNYLTVKVTWGSCVPVSYGGFNTYWWIEIF